MILLNHNKVSGGHTDPPGQIQCPGVQHSSTAEIAAQQLLEYMLHLGAPPVLLINQPFLLVYWDYSIRNPGCQGTCPLIFPKAAICFPNSCALTKGPCRTHRHGRDSVSKYTGPFPRSLSAFGGFHGLDLRQRPAGPSQVRGHHRIHRHRQVHVVAVGIGA